MSMDKKQPRDCLLDIAFYCYLRCGSPSYSFFGITLWLNTHIGRWDVSLCFMEHLTSTKTFNEVRARTSGPRNAKPWVPLPWNRSLSCEKPLATRRTLNFNILRVATRGGNRLQVRNYQIFRIVLVLVLKNGLQMDQINVLRAFPSAYLEGADTKLREELCCRFRSISFSPQSSDLNMNRCTSDTKTLQDSPTIPLSYSSSLWLPLLVCMVLILPVAKTRLY